MDDRLHLWAYHSRLRAAAIKLCGNRADADDLVQDTLERALRARDRLRWDEDLGPWLSVVLHNRFRDLRNCWSRCLHLVEADEPVVAFEPEPEPAWRAVTSEQLARAAKALTGVSRRVYQLRAVQGLSYEAIAEELRIPVATVGTRLRRARLKLRAQLEPPPEALRQTG